MLLHSNKGVFKGYLSVPATHLKENMFPKCSVHGELLCTFKNMGSSRMIDGLTFFSHS